MAPSYTTCPSREELLALHLGELDEAQTAHVGEHLLSCPRCEEQARQLDALSNTVLASLRHSLRAAPGLRSGVEKMDDGRGSAGGYAHLPHRMAPLPYAPADLSPPAIRGYEMLG